MRNLATTALAAAALVACGDANDDIGRVLSPPDESTLPKPVDAATETRAPRMAAPDTGAHSPDGSTLPADATSPVEADAGLGADLEQCVLDAFTRASLSGFAPGADCVTALVPITFVPAP